MDTTEPRYAAQLRCHMMKSPGWADNSVIAFDPSMHVGVPAVDAQHQSLIGELNRLVADVHAVPSSEVFSEALCRLGRELISHFDFEEQVLGSLAMPAQEIDAHVAAHARILGQYTDLNLELMRPHAVSRNDVLVMIRRWIVEHITEHDVAIRRYLIAQR